jgi:hypothetical protein
MNAILFLLAVGTLFGLALGLYFSWVAILASGIALTVVAAAVLQRESYGALVGIAAIVVCLTAKQIAYLAGVTLKIGGGRKPPSNLRGSIWVR